MKALIVVDFQVDFVNGSLGFPGAPSLEKEILSLIETYEKRGDEVIFTLDKHGPKYLQSEEGKYLPILHCIEGTPGYEIYGKVKDKVGEHKVFAKPAFGSSDLLDYLKGKNFEEIALCGIDTSICVLSNAVIAKVAEPNAHIVVYKNASGSGDKKAEEVALEALKRIQVEIR